MQVGERPGRRATWQPRQGARDIRTFIYRGAGWTHTEKQPDRGARR